MALDITDDYTIFDNVEAVTVYLRRDGTVAVDITNGLRGAPSKQERQALAGLLEGDEQTWFIPNDELNPNSEGREMKAGDEVTLTGETWTVLSSTQVAMGSSISGWQCVCRKHI